MQVPSSNGYPVKHEPYLLNNNARSMRVSAMTLDPTSSVSKSTYYPHCYTGTFNHASSGALLLLDFLTSLDIAYNVIAVDKAKNPINMKATDAKAIFVTMRCSIA